MTTVAIGAQETYTVPDDGKVNIPIVPGKWQPYRRNKPGGTLETDAVMKQRIISDVLRRRVRP